MEGIGPRGPATALCVFANEQGDIVLSKRQETSFERLFTKYIQSCNLGACYTAIQNEGSIDRYPVSLLLAKVRQRKTQAQRRLRTSMWESGKRANRSKGRDAKPGS